MGNPESLPPGELAEAALEVEIASLETQMPQLQMKAGNMFAFANAWAERYDAILARTPPRLLPSVEARLRRIGIRWGVVSGARVTVQCPALPPVLPRVPA